MNLSKDQKVKNAIKDINAMDTVDQVQAYTAGDDRPDVINAANVQIEFITQQGAGDRGQETEEPVLPNPEAPTLTPEPSTLTPAVSSAPKDTTPEWIGKFKHLQPKQGQASAITQKSEDTGIKGPVVQKDHRNKILTIRNNVPHWVYYDEKGDELRAEAVPGHGTPIVTKEVQTT